MSLATYGGLKAELAGFATRSDLTTELDTFCLWAHQEICRRLRANVLLSTADVSVTTETAAQPANFLAIRRFYLDITPRIDLRVISADAAAERTGDFSTLDYPDSVAVVGSNFYFAPLFSTATTGKLLFYQAPALMRADSDTNVVLAKYPFLYLWGGLEALFLYLEDDNNADRYGQRFGALIEDINTRDAKDMLSGPVMSIPAPGSVV